MGNREENLMTKNRRETFIPASNESSGRACTYI